MFVFRLIQISISQKNKLQEVVKFQQNLFTVSYVIGLNYLVLTKLSRPYYMHVFLNVNHIILLLLHPVHFLVCHGSSWTAVTGRGGSVESSNSAVVSSLVTETSVAAVVVGLET